MSQRWPRPVWGIAGQRSEQRVRQHKAEKGSRLLSVSGSACCLRFWAHANQGMRKSRSPPCSTLLSFCFYMLIGMGERERALLSSIRSRAATRGRRTNPSAELRVGIGDDAAVLSPRRGEEIVVTTDFSLEDVHFRRAWHPPEAVGHKCLARGLSDIAAMGARPIAIFLSLAVPVEFSQARRGRKSWPGSSSSTWVDRFYDGLLALASRYRVPLAGGDLAQSPGEHAKAAADIIVLGAVKKGSALLRSGAHAGDLLYVTGTLGGAAAELRALEQRPANFRNVTKASTSHPHLFPEPRLRAGQALVARALATAAIDISDGLSVDLLHLCEESKLCAEVNATALPIGRGATQADALHGGDDYELLFTAHPAKRIPRPLGGVPITAIGRMLPRRRGQPPMRLLENGSRSPLEPGGWQHF